KGIEADNNGNDNTAQPMSNPTISNVTLVGISIEDGMRLRRGTAGEFTNILIKNFENGIDVRDEQTIANIQSNRLSVAGKIKNVAAEKVVGQNSAGDAIDVSSIFTVKESATGADDAFAAGWTRYASEGYGLN